MSSRFIVRPLLIALAAIFLFPTLSFAQESETERKLMMFRIERVLEREGRYLAIIKFNEDDGLFVGSSGVARSVYKNAGREGDAAKELGRATVLAFQDSLSIVEIVLTDTTSFAGFVYDNDLVEISTDIPDLEYRSVFFDLVKNAIDFADNDSEIIFGRDDVLLFDSPEFEMEILGQMAQFVRDTGEMIRPMIPDNPQWDLDITGGRYAGLKLVDAMEKTTEAEVKAFLMFVNSFPGKYIGQTWKINETFATWLINDAPPGSEELRDMFLAETDEDRFAQLVTENAGTLDDGIFTTNWNNEAEAFGEESRFEEAFALSDVIAKIANQLGDKSMYAYMLFSRADIEASNENLQQSVAHYEEAIVLFDELGDSNGKALATNNLGNKLNDLDRYEEASELFATAIELKKQQMIDNPTTDYRNSLASSYYGRGKSLVNLGKLNDALASYLSADSLYVSEGSLSSQRSHIFTITEVGKTLLKLDLYDEALEKYAEAYNVSESLGNIEGMADALDEIGYAYSLKGDNEKALASFEEAYKGHIMSDNVKDAGYSKSQMGQSLWRLNRYDEAIEAHREAISIREKVGYVTGQAYSWSKLAELYKNSGDPINSIEAYATASKLYAEVGNRSGSADVLEDLGDLYVSQSDYGKAIEIHKQALALRQEMGLELQVATSLSDVASAYYNLSQFDNAKEYYQQAADIRRKNGDKSGLTNSLSNLGNITYFHYRDYPGATALYDEASAIAKEINSASDQSYIFRGLARIATDQGDIEKAIELYKNALPLSDGISEEVDTKIDLGELHLLLGQFEVAREYFDSAYASSEKANSRNDLAKSLRSMAGLEITIGQPTKALQSGMQSLRIAQEVKNPWGIAGSHLIIGNAYNMLGTNELAISNYLIADSIWADLGSELARATPSNNIGTIYYHQGDFAGSLPYFTSAFNAQSDAKIEDNFMVLLLGNIGAVHMKMGDFELGSTWLEKAVAMAEELKVEPSLASALALLGENRFKQNRIDEAEALLLKSQAIATRIDDRSNLSGALLWLGKLYSSTGKFDAAVESLAEGARLAKEIMDNRGLWQIQSALGETYKLMGNKASAIEQFSASVATIEQLSNRLAFGNAAKELFSKSDGRSEVYEQLISLLIEEGKTELAMSYIERSNSEALRKSLASLNIEFANPEKTAAINSEKEQKATIQALDQQIKEQKALDSKKRQSELIASLERKRSIAEQDYVRFVNQTIRSFPELSVHLSDSVNPKDLSKVKQNIPRDTAVIAYLVGDTGTFIFVANTDTVRAVALDITAKQVNDMVNEVHAGLKAPGSGVRRGAGSAGMETEQKSIDINAALTDLYRLLIDPIESSLIDKENIAIIPSGSLHKLPFQVLSDRENGKSALVDNHTVFYTSNLDIFSNESLKQDLRIVAFGNADESLEWSEREVSEIASSRPNTQVFLREEATESRVKNVSADYNVLHLATHGTLDYNDFENSFLTLAKDENDSEDGHLTIAEIWSIVGLDSYRLVTLSACETAVNDDISNGWPISPANAFLDHVPSVIASLWEVDDVATSLLMQRFYENLDTMGTAKALQMAQLSLSSEETYSDPFYWAPFVVMGDWR